MAEAPPGRPVYRNGAGNTALVAGIVALVCAFIPLIGDYVAVPAGVLAVACGWIGLCRDEDGVATNGRDAVIGAALGGAALFVVFLTFAATFV
ncbi:hypothetical protein ASG56_05755 [Rhodococcus sp. Leaf7]|uniref:hypothetical protein n=1 Tax=unclassified Rhodococcus (in: high G+C Gram-positive bacteria) TaxID=192944 RepID=UPI0007013A4D|nr:MULTISPECIES: hypothetical protein [unclassified Rhodococcus (in: high G+C Gram-positive bacteria)]KQU07059.1 hypothetical protein ASG56_05755 [Rhodococcus sp. Leaf7]KQU42577.1 hypothetical protein ASG64_05755 [Rhodococcus sp. Leaf247]